MSELTKLQQTLIELDHAKASVDAYFVKLNETLAALQVECGLDTFFQSPDGTVFKVVKPSGHFVAYRDVGYVRTKRADEARGTLSVKEASEAGFTLPK